jgi:23S rRNA (guanosine2251-2'-O)-methyltransferase
MSLPARASRPSECLFPTEVGDLRFEQVEGRRAVLETLKGDRQVYELLLAEGLRGNQTLREILRIAKARELPVSFLPRREIDRLAKSETHQGVILRVEPYRYSTLRKILEKCEGKEEDPLVVLLDGVTDPRNLGSIARTCEAVGVDGLIIPRSRSSPVTPVVFHTSAGAVENLPVATVPNLATAIRELKETGFWVVGADAEAETSCFRADLTGPLAVVMGSEGEGLHRLVRESCDALVSIPMFGKVESLNVSVATAIILYEVLRQRGKL